MQAYYEFAQELSRWPGDYHELDEEARLPTHRNP